MKYTMDKGFYSRMLQLAMPIALQNLLASCAGLVDTAMVVGLGNNEMAAIGVAGRWTFLLNLILFGFCSGSAALISQFWGARDKTSIRKVFGLALTVSMVIAVIYNIVAFCFPEQLMRVYTPEPAVIAAGAVYLRSASFMAVFFTFTMIAGAALRATEDVMTPLVASGIAVISNTILNYILIYGHFGFPAMGLKGAAIATVIGTAIGSFFLLGIAFKKRSIIIAPLKQLFDYEKTFAMRYFRTAAPVLGNEVLWAVGTNVYVMVLARQGAENYAAYTMFNSIEQLAFVFFVGVCSACSIMVGKSIGEGKLELAYQKAKRFMVLTPIMGVVVGILLTLVSGPILRLLPIETDYARHVTQQLLIVYSCWLPIRMISYTSVVGIFRAGGDTKTGFYYDILTVFCLGIPTVFLLGMVFKVNFVVIVIGMYMAEDIVKTILCLRRFPSRKWIKRLTLPGDNCIEEDQNNGN